MSKKESIKKSVTSELSEAKEFAKATNIEDVKSGQWFISLLSKLAKTYDKNVTAEYFQKKYPGLTPDEIADILIGVTVKYATVAGGVAGATITANQITLLSSAGATAAIMAGSIGAEIIYLARLQMKLVLDLSVVYDIRLDPEDPEDMLLVFGYALGVVPTELIGKSVEKAAGAGTQYAIKKYLSKGTLQTVQSFGKRIGMKILQRSVIKYAVPIASAAIGSSYNYFTTKTIGRIAKSHLKNRGKVTEELRSIISKRNTYHIVFPAAVLYMAQIDGKVTKEEKDLYMAVISRLKLEDHEQSTFQELLSSEKNIFESVEKLEDNSIRQALIRVLSLMAISDGHFSDEEKDFLLAISKKLSIEVNLMDLEEQAKDYMIVADDSLVGMSESYFKSVYSSASKHFNNAFKRKDMP